jgi:RNA-directed DNA polymerase
VVLRTGHWVGKLFIPKGKLNDLRHKIKVKVKGITTGCSLAEVISNLNPVIVGWRNYYRYAIRAYREFNHLDRWIWQRVGRWLRRKHGKATWPMLRRRYHLSAPGQRRQWTEGAKRLRFLCDGGTMHYPDQSIAKPNGWTTDGGRQQRESVRGFWNAFQRLRHI